VGLLDVRIEGQDRSETRFPHLWTLWRPLTVLGAAPRHALLVPISAAAGTPIGELLLEAAARTGRDPRVEVVATNAERIVYRVSAVSEAATARADLERALADSLAGAAVSFGPSTPSEVVE
jgi:hypothetical protein